MKLSRLTFTAFMLLGLVIGGLGLGTISHGISTAAWHPTQGAVLSSEKKEFWVDNHLQYEPTVVYSYKVGNQSFNSNRISFGSYSSGYKHAQEILNRYPAGAKIQVFYDPSNPEESVLEKGIDLGAYLALLGGLAIFAAPWGLSYLGKRFEQNPPLPL